MKYAKSLRWGGSLVEAVKCDRQSYLQLGLLCPYCGEPVFWREGEDRKQHTRKVGDKTTTVKASHVPPCFVHFEAPKHYVAASCQFRASKTTEKEPKINIRKEIQIRDKEITSQSLKLFKKHILYFVKQSALTMYADNDVKVYEHLAHTSISGSDDKQKVNRILKAIEYAFTVFFRKARYQVSKEVSSTISEMNTRTEKLLTYICGDSFISKEIHHKICHEAVKYLATQAGNDALMLLFKCAYASELQECLVKIEQHNKDGKGILSYDDALSELLLESRLSSKELELFCEKYSFDALQEIVSFSHSSKAHRESFKYALCFIASAIVSIPWAKLFGDYQSAHQEYLGKLKLLDVCPDIKQTNEYRHIKNQFGFWVFDSDGNSEYILSASLPTELENKYAKHLKELDLTQKNSIVIEHDNYKALVNIEAIEDSIFLKASTVIFEDCKPYTEYSILTEKLTEENYKTFLSFIKANCCETSYQMLNPSYLSSVVSINGEDFAELDENDTFIHGYEDAIKENKMPCLYTQPDVNQSLTILATQRMLNEKQLFVGQAKLNVATMLLCRLSSL